MCFLRKIQFFIFSMVQTKVIWKSVKITLKVTIKNTLKSLRFQGEAKYCLHSLNIRMIKVVWKKLKQITLLNYSFRCRIVGNQWTAFQNFISFFWGKINRCETVEIVFDNPRSLKLGIAVRWAINVNWVKTTKIFNSSAKLGLLILIIWKEKEIVVIGELAVPKFRWP